MKKFSTSTVLIGFVLSTFLLTTVLTVNATVWRVNNRPNVDADFSTLSAAYNAASSNDTIYLEGSPTSYGYINCYKTLTFIGAGYWLTENDSTQAYKESSIVDYLTFLNGSEGSVVEGLFFYRYYPYTSYGINIYANNITIRRNLFRLEAYNAGQSSTGINIENEYSSITIEQNWIETATNTEGNAFGINVKKYAIDLIIKNNIIFCDTNDHAIYFNLEDEASSAIINNNVIMGNITTYYSAHYNNILLWGIYTEGTGDVYSNNLCNETQFPNINSNQQNVDMTTVFEDFTSYIDNGYFLITGSPAIGAGVGGVDCGAFGTNDPYVLSGMPPIPAIFESEVTQSIGTTTIPVTIKAMSHK